MSRPIAALIYDFDQTLSPGDMQEYGFMPGIGTNPGEFWPMCQQFKYAHNADGILSYMYMMMEKAKGEMDLSRDSLMALGKDIKFYPGVETWFDRINEIGDSLGVDVEHYIISSGLTEIIRGSKIGEKFKAVFAASFCYDDEGTPIWPATAVNYTSKTQYLFRINKGILDVTNDADLNAYTPQYKRRIPFSNMVYIGDGSTDVPCMKMTKQRGGYSLAVHKPCETAVSDDMLLHGRVDFAVEADYSAGSEMEIIITELFRRIKSTHELSKRHEAQMRRAYKRRGDEAFVLDAGMRGGLPEDGADEELE